MKTNLIYNLRNTFGCNMMLLRAALSPSCSNNQGTSTAALSGTSSSLALLNNNKQNINNTST